MVSFKCFPCEGSGAWEQVEADLILPPKGKLPPDQLPPLSPVDVLDI